MTQRRKFSPECKREAVVLTRQPGVSCRQVALDIGINPNMLSRWVLETDDAQASFLRAREARVIRKLHA
ncbi:transposase [Halothiobacillus neapolitanus]|nr:transposase [Halothiobacillus neapolitanus]